MDVGWNQIHISSYDIFRASTDLPGRTAIVADVLANETDPYFLWQFDLRYKCPKGCRRLEGGWCGVV